MSRPLFISVNGTGVPDPYGPGFSGDIGRALTDPWNNVMASFWGPELANVFDWQPIGYDAAVMGMDKSARGAVYRKPGTYSSDDTGGIVAQVLARPKGTKHVLSGYSQGAIATGICLVECYFDPKGPLNDRLSDLKGVVNFGDPKRSPGIANGNKVAGLPMPKKLDGYTTGGIAGPGCLKPDQTPDWLLSCALDGDLYAAAPVGDDPWHNEPLVGQIETRIYDFIQSGKLSTGIMAIAKGIAQEFEHPLANTVALVQAIVNGLTFAAQGVQAPHWLYGPFVPAMVEWILAQV
ncbi:hypothetical protein A5747_13270 [Mycobacterium sp. IS-836]|uniref:cutinase family protein n=1 Tax=Mycobacterium sp. IS-836 TaxID=1834160 RepID=UPI00096D54C7|nr:cutinase family protein [Mycobacterium sp. IS-836]OMC55360.1 hypothetical protein A5747_13270 [Mycobacterium sp. IS-836]